MYADKDDFARFCKGEEIPEEELTARLEEAQRDIDGLTYNRINTIGFEALTDFQKEQVKCAVCKQASFRYTYADFLEMPLSSYGINGVSMQFGGAGIVERNGVQTSAYVMNVLRQTGLCYLGLDGRAFS